MPPVATGLKPNYDLTITDGVNTVGFLTLGGRPDRVRRLPRGVGVERKVIKQNDWSGGRGQEMFKDPSRYMDGSGLWPMVAGQLTAGPLPVPCLWALNQGYGSWVRDRDSAGNQPSNYNFQHIAPPSYYLAQSFIASSAKTLTVRRVRFWVRRIGTPDGDLRVALHSDNSNAPGTIERSVTIAPSAIEEGAAVLKEVEFSSDFILTNTSRYWVSWYQPTGTDQGTTGWEVLFVNPVPTADGAAISVTGGSTWNVGVLTDRAVVQVVTTTRANDLGQPHLFEYKRAIYMLDNQVTGIQMNGDRGVATGGSQTTTTLGDSTKTWTTNQWRGCTLYFYNGPNKGLSRLIASNTATVITVTEALPTAPTTGATGSEYVILGSDTWQSIALSGAPNNPTDVKVMNGIIYVARGEGLNMRRIRQYNNAGVWTTEDADDGTNRASLLEVALEGTKTYLYRARNDTYAVSRAEKQAWGANLTFEADLPIGAQESAITGLVWHDDKLYVVLEDDLYAVRNNIPSRVPNPIRNGRDLTNGVRVTGWNTNLYFPFLDGLERFYGSIGDDIGPNRDAGMPSDRRGVIADFLPVYGYGFAALDAGSNTSALLVTNYPGGGWHELFRAGESNYRLRRLLYQSVPLGLNRLWFYMGRDLYYLTMPRSTTNPLNDPTMVYGPGGHLITSWYEGDGLDLDKLFTELGLFSKNLPSAWPVRVYYRINSDGAAWTYAGLFFSVSPYQRLAIGGGTLTGRRIQFLIIFPTQVLTSVVMHGLDLRANEMNEVKYDYVIDVRGGNRLQLLHGDEARASSEQATAVLVQLESWQENATRLTLSTRHPAVQTIYGHIDPVAIVLDKWTGDDASFSGSITFKEA
jgi:hypothetical protein